MATRDKFRGLLGSVKPVAEPAPELGEGESVLLTQLGTAARLDWAVARDKALSGDKGVPDPSAMLLVLSARDSDDPSKPAFQMQDCDWLSSNDFPSPLLERLNDRIMKLSGMSDEVDEDGKDAAVVDAEGNSDATPSGDSPSV